MYVDIKVEHCENGTPISKVQRREQTGIAKQLDGKEGGIGEKPYVKRLENSQFLVENLPKLGNNSYGSHTVSL